MDNREIPLPGAHLGKNHIKTGFIPRQNRQNTSEHILDIQIQKNDHISDENQETDTRSALLFIRSDRVFTKRCGNSLPPVGFFHGDLPRPGTPIKNHANGDMVHQIFPLLHPDKSEIPNKRHKWTHYQYPQLLHISWGRSHTLQPVSVR